MIIWRFSYASAFSVFPQCSHENRYNLRSCAISSRSWLTVSVSSRTLWRNCSVSDSTSSARVAVSL